MATFPPAVERWRSLVARYFPADLVDKALWTIQHESGGNPGAVGDGGAARGLFQIQDRRNFADRPDAAYLDDPENNIRYAAEQLGGASGNFGAWGEGTSYDGQPFGAFGHNQYPGSEGGNAMPGGPPVPSLPFSEEEYYQKLARYKKLEVLVYNPILQTVDPTKPGVDEFLQLEAELQRYEDARDQGAQDWNTYFDFVDRQNATDPRKIDADAAAAKWTREFGLAEAADASTQGDMQEQRLGQDAAREDFTAFKSLNHFQNPGGFRVPSTNLPTKDELYAENFSRLAARLPEVKPFYPERPGSFANSLPKLPASVIPPGAGANPTYTRVGSRGGDENQVPLPEGRQMSAFTPVNRLPEGQTIVDAWRNPKAPVELSKIRGSLLTPGRW